VLAERIVADRKARGPFRDVSDLARVPGVGRVRSERLRGLVTIP
jgi:DNA uptake protein ComE-like DNA-binding protein